MTAVRIDHADPRASRVTLVDWTLGNRCNYACSYCPAALHDGSVGWQDREAVFRFANRVIDHYLSLGQSLLFQFSGGEPTLYRPLEELAAHLRVRGARVGVISNGSRTIGWWERFRLDLDQIVFTHHVEHVELAHFLDVLRVVSETVSTHVNVTMVPARFAECLRRAETIRDSELPVGVTLKALREGFGARLFEYSALQRAVLEESWPSRANRAHDFVGRGQMLVTHGDGHTERLRANEFIVRGSNRWPGWECRVGVESLAINAEGYVFRGVCTQGGRLGHISDPNIELPRTPTVCGFASCKCAADITITRHDGRP